MGMKIAISVPEQTCLKAEAVASRLGTSRSAAFVKAMDAFQLDDDDLTEQINRIVDSMTEEERAEQKMLLRAGAATVLRNTEW
jgi:hypothetical protein